MKKHARHIGSFAFAFVGLLLVAHPQNSPIAGNGPSVSTPTSEAPAGEQPFVNWSRRNAIRLQTVEAGHGFADMQPLARVVGNARIVALGEATHGTREFFQLKHRMLEFLASQMGFSIFSIEANMPEAYQLNDYVLHGTGDPKKLVKGMGFWTWNTEEVLDMVLWMREFNLSGRGRIEFTGFDMQTPTKPIQAVQTFVMTQDAPYYATLWPIYQDVSRMAQSEQSGPAVATAKLAPSIVAGKHIKYSGYIKTESITHGYAGLWWRVDGGKEMQPLAFDNMSDRGAKGTTPWTYYEISIDVPADAKHVNFGILHTGDGTAWFDSLNIEINGIPYRDGTLFDPDFESATPEGFYMGGDGYEITLDASVAHSGKQSLRTQKRVNTYPSTNAKALIGELLVERCGEVVKHLETKRAEKVLQGSTPRQIDWVIQNAELVLQYVQMKTGGKTRDEAMADNVKWIADHNPGAKLVLWAHNGHIAYSGFRGYVPMGGYLRKMFASQLINFGFAFNQGSFQAVEMGKDLHDFSVGPAPEGSLDRTLAAAGIPILALDLRQVPKQGPVAQWIGQPHASRTIGAVYNFGNEASYFVTNRPQDAFDVILFVEKTTAARENH